VIRQARQTQSEVSGKAAKVVPFAPVLNVATSDRVDSAAKKVLVFHMDRLASEIDGIKKDTDVECVHRGRVAVRRMRSALSLFGPMLGVKRAEVISRDLKWIGALLGRVRDIDVFLLKLPRYAKLKRFAGEEEMFLVKRLMAYRSFPLKALSDALGSARYKRMERRLRALTDTIEPKRPSSSVAVKKISDAVPSMMEGMFESVVEKGSEAFKKQRMKDFHKLRIEAKRLRYGLEAISPAYGRALDPFIKRLVEMQDCLGDMQDTVFTRGFIDDILDGKILKGLRPGTGFVLGEIYMLQREIASDCRRDFSGIWRRFASKRTLRDLKKGLRVKPVTSGATQRTTGEETA